MSNNNPISYCGCAWNLDDDLDFRWGTRFGNWSLARDGCQASANVFLIFIVESVMLPVPGGALGVCLGMLGAFSLTLVVPGLPVYVD
jgi:hypothetical protein